LCSYHTAWLSGPQVCSHLCFLDGRKTKEKDEEEEEVLEESTESLRLLETPSLKGA
jgi:hypothetical protein